MKSSGRKIILILVCLFFAQAIVAKDKRKNFGRAVKKFSKKLIRNIDSTIKRTKFDSDIDEMIEGRLGSRYRRANVFDFYPMELSSRKAFGKSERKERELMGYYNYAREDLEHISGSKLLNVVKMDFDKDKDWDYAVIVHDTKKKKNYLTIMNYHEDLYFAPFKADYLEKHDEGRSPTTLVYSGNKTKDLEVPAMRMVSFDNKSKVIYYNQKKQNWELVSLND